MVDKQCAVEALCCYAVALSCGGCKKRKIILPPFSSSRIQNAHNKTINLYYISAELSVFLSPSFPINIIFHCFSRIHSILLFTTFTSSTISVILSHLSLSILPSLPLPLSLILSTLYFAIRLFLSHIMQTLWHLNCLLERYVFSSSSFVSFYFAIILHFPSSFLFLHNISEFPRYKVQLEFC